MKFFTFYPVIKGFMDAKLEKPSLIFLQGITNQLDFIFYHSKS
ncbi:MAG: hypothetical protein TECD_00843 [Hyphomicrobiaceae bacterium hypho_1]